MKSAMKKPRWAHEAHWRTECRRRHAEVRQDPGEWGGNRGWANVLIWISRTDIFKFGKCREGDKGRTRDLLQSLTLLENSS